MGFSIPLNQETLHWKPPSSTLGWIFLKCARRLSQSSRFFSIHYKEYIINVTLEDHASSTIFWVKPFLITGNI